MHTAVLSVPEAGLTVAELNSDLFDIYDQRLTRMDENGVDFMALSCSSPCIQGISDPATAESMAISLNNQLAAQIYNDSSHPNITGRFGAFAALSMHNASAAAVELRRAIQELGFLGALVNDYQQTNDTLLFFYQPEYDVFWDTVTELDVPVYFHPRNNVAPISTLFYTQVPWLKGPAQEFSATLSTHVLGLCTNGVFDRFPTLKVIVGHMGERIPSDLDRIDKSLAEQKSNGMPMLLNVSTYFHTNIWETCSGSFNPSLLEFHRKEIGLERMMYSIDYPFVQMEDGKAFLDELEEGRVLTREEMRQFTRETAIGLLKLNE
ncbi:amidohydrolase 2 [Gymnopus androsaceus JB14]|uniref:Amidohydrolase 2 n=1 Tax=Gymnopus androsaceus JB14 TaxID=1447944 RepID=A0A6A4I601_9AGAR|nr:amidohydrolase 2 [Gymnopus androsaceus JB14]